MYFDSKYFKHYLLQKNLSINKSCFKITNVLAHVHVSENFLFKFSIKAKQKWVDKIFRWIYYVTLHPRPYFSKHMHFLQYIFKNINIVFGQLPYVIPNNRVQSEPISKYFWDTWLIVLRKNYHIFKIPVFLRAK